MVKCVGVYIERRLEHDGVVRLENAWVAMSLVLVVVNLMQYGTPYHL